MDVTDLPDPDSPTTPTVSPLAGIEFCTLFGNRIEELKLERGDVWIKSMIQPDDKWGVAPQD